MRKVLAGFVVVVFSVLLCISVVSVLGKTAANKHFAGAFNQYPYYTTY